MNIVDDYSSYVWSILLKAKSDAFPKLMAWEKARENETGQRIGTYRTDNGELKSEEMQNWLESRGVMHETTAPYTSAHIGRVERMHRTLLGKANSMRLYAGCPRFLWDEFYMTAAYLHVRTTTRSLSAATLYEMWKGKKPDCSHLREIGCRAFVLIQPTKANPKINERLVECTLIGYETNAKAYRCYHHATKKVYISYHVCFLESHEGHAPTNMGKADDQQLFEKSKAKATLPDVQSIVQSAADHPYIEDDDGGFFEPPPEPDPPQEHQNEVNNSIKRPPAVPQSTISKTAEEDPKPAPELRRSSRKIVSEAERLDNAIKDSKEAGERKREERKARAIEKKRVKEEKAMKKEERVNNHQEGITQMEPSPPTAEQLDQEAVKELRQMFDELGVDEETRENINEILSAVQMEGLEVDSFEETSGEPTTWEEARNTPQAESYRTAILEEIQGLKEMKVYALVPPSAVPSGCDQRYGRDYTKTTSPTARMESARVLMHIAAKRGWDVQQLDVKTAYLYSLLPEDETQYMYQPEGFEEPGKEGWVWKLQRGLYGMKQSGRLWNQTLNAGMEEWGFKRLRSDACVYYRKRGNQSIITLVHVDDFLSIATTKEENEAFKEQMRTKWTISELGRPKQFLGIAVEYDDKNNTVLLSQAALIDKIVSQFGQSNAHPCSTPMDPGLKLRRPDKLKFSREDFELLSKLPFRSLIGCLLYLALGTRPDIAYAVQQLSQFLDNFSYAHWNAAIRVVRYLKGTRDLKLHLGGQRDAQIVGFTDSDWANCPDTRRSVGGYCFTLGTGLISWTAKKQQTVAASSCEAEYVAAFEASKESEWLRSLTAELDMPQQGPTTILCDNRAAIILSKDPLLHSRVKHVDIKYHFLRERYKDGKLVLKYINTHDNIADLFTKPLTPGPFQRFRALAGVKP
ncbi:hypothetical protein NMY22_g5310 [Coprinellus aureogranulatus]|nr:hypothetical protein NMY22_g5310 [Coprinellus aureogranulatus]